MHTVLGGKKCGFTGEFNIIALQIERVIHLNNHKQKLSGTYVERLEF